MKHSGILIVVAVALVACQPRGQALPSSQPLVVQESPDPQESWPSHEPFPKLETDKSVQVIVATRFISADPKLLAKLSLDKERTITRKQADEAVKAMMKDYHSRTLTAPRLQSYAGQQACVEVFTQQAYVADATAVVKDGEVTLESLERHFKQGSGLWVQGEADGNRVSLRAMFRTSGLLGLRECRGQTLVTTASESLPVYLGWQEPVILEGYQQAPKPYILEGGQVLVLPLTYRVVQSTGAKGRVAVGATLREISPAFVTPMPAVVLVEAQLVRPATQTAPATQDNP